MTTERLSGLHGGKTSREVIPSFLDFIKGSEYGLGYNVAEYDMPVLMEEMKRVGLSERIPELSAFKTVDIYHAVKSYGIGEGSAGQKLTEIAEHFQRMVPDERKDLFSTAGAHNAARDIELTHNVAQEVGRYIGKGFEGLLNEGGRELTRIDLEKAAQRGMPKLAGTPLPLREMVIRGNLGADAIEAVGKHTARYQKAIVGAGMVVGGAWLLSRVLGKDDNYNTIPGMNEYGLAARMRKQGTDFGSGYRGPVVSGQIIPEQVVTFRERWMSSQEAQDELEARKKASQTAYGKLGSNEIIDMGNGRALVDASAYKLEWEDADTLLLRQAWWKIWKNDVAIRLTGIDAPEISEHGNDPTSWFRFREAQPRGKWAAKRIREMTEGKQLRIEIASDPKAQTYGRYLGLVYNKGERKSLNLQMVEQGIVAALPFGESGSDIYPRATYLAAEQEAIQAERGIWGEGFFKRYLAVSKGLGGRLTFNTLTDLTRLAKNYHLAAAQEYIWNGNDLDTGRLLGRKLIPSYGRFFSGNHRAHNTIEGMSEQGTAASLRKTGTDFGSGFVAPKVSGPIAEFFSGMSRDFISSVKQYSGTVGIAGAVGLYYGWQKGKEEGEIKWGQFASLIAMDMADDLLLFGSIQGAKRWPSLVKIRPYIEHPYVKQGGMALFGFTMGKLTGEIGANLFSGKDDAYNTVEGMRHGGWAEVQRKYMTDFGSGFLGNVVKSFKELATTSASSVRRGFKRFLTETETKVVSFATRSPEFQKMVKDMGETAEGFSNYLYNWAGPGFASVKIGDGGELVSTIAVDPTRIQSFMRKVIGWDVSARELKLAKEHISRHETFEVFHDRTTKLHALERGLPIPERRFAGHTSGAVVGDDLMWAAHHSEEMFAYVKKFHELASANQAKMGKPELAVRYLKILSSFEEKWLPRIRQLPGRGHAFNGFDGMSEGVMAKSGRHATTPHGSKIDPVKLFLQGEKILPEKVFRSGKLIKQLGEPGAYGSASLYSATYQGKKFAYVKKLYHPRAPGTILSEEALATMAEREAQTMIALRDIPGVPKIYGYTTTKKQSFFSRFKSIFTRRPAENAIYMEYVPGKPIDALLSSGGEVSKATQERLAETVRAIASRGIEHVDLHPGNILATKKGATVIDWGLVDKFSPVGMEKAMAEARMQSNIDRVLSSRRLKTVERAEKLKASQRALASSAINGGKNHTRFVSSGRPGDFF